MTETKTKSEVPVAAREQLEQLTEPTDPTSNLEQAAKDQEKQQASELKAGQSGGETKDGPTVAHNRSQASVGVQNGFIDQNTRRDTSDVMEGHFCTVDSSHKDVNADDLPAGDGFGVYVEPAVLDKDGYPVTARVLHRNEVISRVYPYEALKPAEPRGV